jgi:hypothetical protein
MADRKMTIPAAYLKSLPTRWQGNLPGGPLQRRRREIASNRVNFGSIHQELLAGQQLVVDASPEYEPHPDATHL